MSRTLTIVAGLILAAITGCSRNQPVMITKDFREPKAMVEMIDKLHGGFNGSYRFYDINGDGISDHTMHGRDGAVYYTPSPSKLNGVTTKGGFRWYRAVD